ncbi:curli production assembly protein CsgG [Shewanella psychropiezotolerans]|uniref:Curli production assembly/transport component CsgG n=1 Tax=Shewanella psychropiezotolerans TaxID=2593655 RepID=A0ABX5X0A8_9GAMM|nr:MULTISPECIES: CsgG/HfaB family protein [Shewanella]MPY23022.1 curli production assembly protein CsgG [Shewanella sp. YLB-07]QDO82686.1 curli production assembly protein CsgG [Shewanella psychropiezotolerans]
MNKWNIFVFTWLTLFCLQGPAFATGLDATSSNTSIKSDSAQTFLKRKIAIARFSNETQAANSFLVDSSNNRIGKQAADILSARLADTNKFIMFERLDSDEVNSENILKGINDSGVSVDYLIVGSVSEFGRSAESTTGLFSQSKIQKAYTKVNVRLVDVTTGRIISSVEGAGEATTETKKTLGAGTSAAFDQSLTDKALSQAISQMISNLVENMTAKPWKSYFLSNEDGTFIISGGEAQGLSEGMELVVYQNGKQVKNPQTGGRITLPGKKIGKIQVLSTYGNDEFEQISFVDVVEGSISDDLSKYYLSDK